MKENKNIAKSPVKSKKLNPLIKFITALKTSDSGIMGIILVILSTFFFTGGQSIIKLGSAEVSAFHLLFWRSFVGLVMLSDGSDSTETTPISYTQ